MVILIRSLGFYSVVLNGIFIIMGISMLFSMGLLESSFQNMPGGPPPGMTPVSISMLKTFMTTLGLAMIGLFGLNLAFAIIVIILSFRKVAQREAPVSSIPGNNPKV